MEICVNDYVEATSKGRSVPCKQCEHGAAVRDCYAAGQPLPKHLRTSASIAKQVKDGQNRPELVSAGQSVPHQARAAAKRRDEMRARLRELDAAGRLDGHRGRRVEGEELARREELTRRIEKLMKPMPVSMAVVVEVAGMKPRLVLRNKAGVARCSSQKLELLLEAVELVREELAKRKRG